MPEATRQVVWLLVTSGRGPGECQLAVVKLAAALVARATAAGLEAEVVDVVPGEAKGAALSALVKAEGAGARAFAARWRGSVQWIAPSTLRPGHKRKNWFVGVEVMGDCERGVGERIDPRDVAFESMRASGAGGQHVNKTESAIRATHRPTGLVATAREERSQAMNKKLALARLQALADAAATAKAADADRDRWAAHDALERGDAVAVFVGPEFRQRR